MSTPDFFRSRLDQMIDLRHPLAVLATRLPWVSIEASVAPKLTHQTRPPKRVSGEDLAGAFEGEFGGGISLPKFDTFSAFSEADLNPDKHLAAVLENCCSGTFVT